MVATRELPVSTPPCRSPFYNDLGGEGDYYYNARWYDANTGRFITEDPARDGSNWYIYTSNNPIKYIDPTGMIFGLSSEESGEYDSDSKRPIEKDDDDDGGSNNQDKDEDSSKSIISPEGPWIIDYYDETGGAIKLDYENQEQFIGENLDFGSLVPADSNIIVPEGSSLEIIDVNGNRFIISGASANLSESIQQYNDVISSKEYQAAIQKNKNQGTAMMVLGGVGIAGSFVLGATTSAETVGTSAAAAGELFKYSATLAAYGLTRYVGMNKQTVYDDVKNTIRPLSVDVAQSINNIDREKLLK